MITQVCNHLTFGLPVIVNDPVFKIGSKVGYSPYYHGEGRSSFSAVVKGMCLTIEDDYKTVQWEYWIEFLWNDSTYQEMVHESELKLIPALQQSILTT